MISNFPLMAIALIAYNVLVFGLGFGDAEWANPVFTINMMSGAVWQFRTSDLMLTVGLFLLFFEVLKATRIGSRSIIDHMLSTLVFILFLIEFLLVRDAATSTFFILMAMALVDVMAGFSVTIRSATRDVSLGDGSGL